MFFRKAIFQNAFFRISSKCSINYEHWEFSEQLFEQKIKMEQQEEMS